jgi:hypothetical protein
MKVSDQVHFSTAFLPEKEFMVPTEEHAGRALNWPGRYGEETNRHCQVSEQESIEGREFDLLTD